MLAFYRNITKPNNLGQVMTMTQQLILFRQYALVIAISLLSNEIYGQDSSYINHIDSIVKITDHKIKEKQLMALVDTMTLEQETLTFLFDENELRATIQRGSKVNAYLIL
jgi:hypothetical protein